MNSLPNVKLNTADRYRFRMVRGELPPPEEARLLVDLAARSFRPLETPEGACRWGGTLD
jgi:hypothetical protein